MSDGLATMQAQIDRLRSISQLPAQVAPKLADAFRAELTAQIARGEAPDGTPWQPTASGAQPLQGAAKALTVTAIGATVVAVLQGPEARHHYGYAAGGIRRQILPTRHLPQPFVQAVKKLVARAFKAHMSGDHG